MSMTKMYLGDSVYAESDGCTVLLTTENSGSPSNKIYLEPEVLQALMDYLEWLKANPR